MRNKLIELYQSWAADRPLLMVEWFAWSTLLLDGLVNSKWVLAGAALVPHIILGKVLLHEED